MTPSAALIFLFYVAGYAMLTHVVLCFILRRGLGKGSDIEGEILAILNRWLGSPIDFRLLRVRYYWPWTALPAGTKALAPWVRTTLTMARITGLLFPLGLLGFFVGVFLTASD